jgi:hypothetical protein
MPLEAADLVGKAVGGRRGAAPGNGRSGCPAAGRQRGGGKQASGDESPANGETHGG